ncbi:hypothetical protein F5Y17DRAFT_200477 [Xylariaceae sp. FL0594]|nr:hypothetical protein F5Y17DRAFT_200477 [Xylariaceae sp. FL0594]
MSTNLLPCPKIDVLRWNADSVYVGCPYCGEVHRHGFSLQGNRASHCARPGGEYEFIFPIDESSGRVGYEINKRRGFFVNVSVQTEQEKETSDDSDSAEGELSHLFWFHEHLSRRT